VVLFKVNIFSLDDLKSLHQMVNFLLIKMGVVIRMRVILVIGSRTMVQNRLVLLLLLRSVIDSFLSLAGHKIVGHLGHRRSFLSVLSVAILLLRLGFGWFVYELVYFLVGIWVVIEIISIGILFFFSRSRFIFFCLTVVGKRFFLTLTQLR
jgi:hypothetical protein